MIDDLKADGIPQSFKYFLKINGLFLLSDCINNFLKTVTSYDPIFTNRRMNIEIVGQNGTK